MDVGERLARAVVEPGAPSLSTRTLRSPRHGDRRYYQMGSDYATIVWTHAVIGYRVRHARGTTPRCDAFGIARAVSPRVGNTAVSDWAGDKYSLSVQHRLMRWSVPRVGAPTAAGCSWRHRDGTLGPRGGNANAGGRDGPTCALLHPSSLSCDRRASRGVSSRTLRSLAEHGDWCQQLRGSVGLPAATVACGYWWCYRRRW